MTQKQKGFVMLLSVGVILVIGFFVMNVKNENTDLKNKVNNYEKTIQGQENEKKHDEESDVRKQTEKEINQNVVDTKLESDTTTFVNKMFNVQNDRNYDSVKKSLSTVTTQDFMAKYFSGEKPQYNYNYETNVTGINIYLNTRQDDRNTMKGLVTFNRFIGVNKEVGNSDDTEEQMTVELTYKKEGKKWLIEHFEIRGQVPFENQKNE